MATCFYCSGGHNSSRCVSLAVTEGTDRVVAQQEAATAEATDLAYSMMEAQAAQTAEIVDAIQELQSFLSWSHSELAWRMEKQIELLTGIHDMIQDPSATQATELFHMGTDSFGRQRYLDALRVLLRDRDLNPGDCRVLVTLGHAYVRMDDIPEAGESFEAAADYARTPGYKHDALLLLSRAHRSLGMADEAVRRAEQAAALVLDDAAAHYEVAMCLAQRLARS